MKKQFVTMDFNIVTKLAEAYSFVPRKRTNLRTINVPGCRTSYVYTFKGLSQKEEKESGRDELFRDYIIK